MNTNYKILNRPQFAGDHEILQLTTSPFFADSDHFLIFLRGVSAKQWCRYPPKDTSTVSTHLTKQYQSDLMIYIAYTCNLLGYILMVQDPWISEEHSMNLY